MAAPGKVRDSYPFSKAREGENVWLTGEAVIAIGDIVQRGNPIPDPNTYEFIQRTSEGVHFGLVSPIISDQSPSSSSMSQSKTAIVPVEAGYLKWHCEERPDVIFRDCVSVPVGADGSATVVVPDLFVQSVAMDSLKLASVVPCGGAAAVEVSRTADGWSFAVTCLCLQ